THHCQARRAQSRVEGAEAETLATSAARNRAYESVFGFIYLVCATGKSAAHMLEILESRFGNDPEKEMRVAAAEQRLFTRLRLERRMEAREERLEQKT